MNTVHSNATRTTSRRNAVRSRRKNPRTRPRLRCAECKLVNDCDCLDTTRILGHLAPLLRQVIDHLQTDGSCLDDEVCERLELLCDRRDQREREWIAMPELGDAEDLKCDHVIVEDLVGHWGYEPSHLRTPEGIAAMRNVPVEHVRALLDRFLRDSQPVTTAPGLRRRSAADERHEILLAATRRLLVDGNDPARTSRKRGRIRNRARQRIRALLGVPAPIDEGAAARETWPTWAREVVAAVERRAA